MSLNVTSGVFYGQIVGFLIGFSSAVTCTATCCWNQWSKTSSTDSASVLGAIWGFNGIWIQCIQHTTGSYNCNNYETAVFQLPTYLNIIRAMMCIAIIISVFGCFTCLVGMQASRLLETTPDAKRILMQVSGAFFIGAGVLTGVSLSWYSAMVLQEFFSIFDSTNMMRYTIGATTYIGIISGILSFSAGIIFLCSPGPKEEDSKYEFDNYMAKPYAIAARPSVRKNTMPYNESFRSHHRRSNVQYV